jgi:coproporphyrinogen III oxidase-like Fe-S oxidoreductase
MGMTREEIIETMIETVNVYNINLMRQSKMDEADITKNVDLQYPALLHMFGLIYNDLEVKDAFK